MALLTCCLLTFRSFLLEFLDEINAVELSLFVDHIESLQLLDLTSFFHLFELVNPHLELPVVHILSVPVWDLVELE